MEKKCNKCQKTKPVSEFGKEARAKNGFKPRCKQCLNEYYNSRYMHWKDKKCKQSIEYFNKNKEDILERRKSHNLDLKNKKEKSKIWHLKNRERINKKKLEYIKEKTKTDSEFRAIRNMRKLIYRLGIEKRGKTAEVLGYTITDLKNKLGRLPERSESFDHKIPVSWFISTEYVKEINSLENLQILTRSKNSSKSNHYCCEVSIEYFMQIKHLIKEPFLNKIKTQS
jgi:hypothetical protein